MNTPEITIDPSLRPRLQQGHPWVYRNHVSGGERLRSGQWVRVRCGGWTAYGLWDARSAIAVRIVSRTAIPDDDWVGERVWEAWELRAAVRDASPATSAYRWIYGEGDGLPGLVADRYGDYAVIHTYADSVQAIASQVASAMRGIDPDLRGVALHQREQDDDEGDAESGPRPPAPSLRPIWGELPPQDLVIQEHGILFRADLWRGQKTGLFLDQRENRRAVESLAGGLTVLNCFAYTGGFSLYALRGGAAEVTSVDIGRGLAEAADDNIALNRLDAGRHRFLTEDCFGLLDAYVKASRRFQMVILDPPSFARAKGSAHAALRAYARLNALAMRCVEPGGLLVTSSCTSQVGPESFRAMLGDAAAAAQRRAQIIYEVGQPADHPVPAAFPEGRYLKFLVARVLAIS
ncbi:class I SAM-dependent rRNA methyltransferase [Oscillochloris sp. ZM17-4]|uniref:class I SAM-dependent rRNA methyltransferase n=1 Tax=Oscillochloris sp. ZM17-4 TaxID=2866714 RepID=UPI001C733410|nr:class I SAM-dependent rRNA methyltransferase [Oscillochloris sp. ZM17-4]